MPGPPSRWSRPPGPRRRRRSPRRSRRRSRPRSRLGRSCSNSAQCSVRSSSASLRRRPPPPSIPQSCQTARSATEMSTGVARAARNKKEPRRCPQLFRLVGCSSFSLTLGVLGTFQLARTRILCRRGDNPLVSRVGGVTKQLPNEACRHIAPTRSASLTTRRPLRDVSSAAPIQASTSNRRHDIGAADVARSTNYALSASAMGTLVALIAGANAPTTDVDIAAMVATPMAPRGNGGA